MDDVVSYASTDDGRTTVWSDNGRAGGGMDGWTDGRQLAPFILEAFELKNALDQVGWRGG
jgi:hypothetical protein